MAAAKVVERKAPNPKQEIYTYQAPWIVYGLAWSNNNAEPYRLAIGSFTEEYSNKVQIVELQAEANALVKIAEFDHPYPSTKIMWHPSKDQCSGTLATTGDYLRLWQVTDTRSSGDGETAEEGMAGAGANATKDATDDVTVEMKCVLNNSKNNEFCAPLTAFDWNQADPNIIGTSSIDTTCTIWDIQAEGPTTQLIAHDKEVYDIAFQQGKHIFASTGADGSVRMFDLRSLECSTILYESKKQPLLRLCWNKNDPHFIATMPMDSQEIVILDIRQPSTPVATLAGHMACVNALAWAPHSSCHICTAGDDKQALIWDLAFQNAQSPATPTGRAQPREPILAYGADAEINNLKWSSAQQDWIGIAYDKQLQILRV